MCGGTVSTKNSSEETNTGSSKVVQSKSVCVCVRAQTGHMVSKHAALDIFFFVAFNLEAAARPS